MTNETTTTHATDFDPVERVKNEITHYIDSLVKNGKLKITKVNSHNLSFELCATAARYALEDQHEPPSKTFTQIVGDLHTSAATRQYLDITQEELDQLVEDHLILKVTDSSGRNGYPAFQFKNGAVRPEIQKLIKPHLDYTYPENPKKTHRRPLGSSPTPHNPKPTPRRLQHLRLPQQVPGTARPRNQNLQHDLHKRAYAY